MRPFILLNYDMLFTKVLTYMYDLLIINFPDVYAYMV